MEIAGITQMRERCALQLLAAVTQVPQLKAFIGLDGFVDEILHVVDKREKSSQYQRLRTMKQFAERLASAAGRSTNIELVSQLAKLGGNGPILANALAGFGVRVAYVGLLGFPALNPVFEEFARRAEVYSIGEPGRTDALEFEDGKIMLGKNQSLNELNWENVRTRFGVEKFIAKVNESNLVGCVNWTMLTHMNDIWSAILQEVCPCLSGPRRQLFVDLCDPEKRTREDVMQMLKLLVDFERYFEVMLGLNEKETCELGSALGIRVSERSPDALSELGISIQQRVPLGTIVIHTTTHAISIHKGKVSLVQGPFTPSPRITTGAGDHFNAGYCLGKLLCFDDASCLLTGVATSGYYVRTATSPKLADLAGFCQNWPATIS